MVPAVKKVSEKDLKHTGVCWDFVQQCFLMGFSEIIQHIFQTDIDHVSFPIVIVIVLSPILG